MRFAIVTLALALILGTPSLAGGFYVGASLGTSDLDTGLDDLQDGSLFGSSDDTDSGWKVFGGYDLLKFLAVEVSWTDLGEAKIDAISDGSGSVFAPGLVTARAELSGATIDAVGLLPVGPIKIFAKVGYFIWDADGSVTNAGTAQSANADGEDLKIGVGALVDLKHLSFRLEWEQFDVEDSDVSLFSGGIAWKF